MHPTALPTQPNHFASLAKWLTARLWTKWLWVRVQLQSLPFFFLPILSCFLFCTLSFLVFLLVLVLFLPSLFIHLFSDAPCCFLFKSSYPLFALPITLLFLLLPLVFFLFNLSSFCYSSSSESSIYTFFLSLKLQWMIWDIS